MTALRRIRILLNYFVTSQAFQRLRNKSKGIVVGLKGSGKSALRKKLEQTFAEENNSYVINISLKYNSIKTVLNDKDIVGYFGKEIFFQHTWLKQILLDCLCQIGNHAKQEYGESSLAFARQVSVERGETSKDIVENIKELLFKIKVKVGQLGEFGLTIEKKLRTAAEVNTLEHHLVSLCKDGAKFVILVDDLDLGWDSSDVANNLLLGLLAAANEVSSLSPNIYTCIFVRENVYSILITKTQHSDKYRNIETIRWDKDGLLHIFNERINFNRQSCNLSKIDNPFIVIFRLTIGTSNIDNWLIERTLARPRELIQLARHYSELVKDSLPSDECLKQSEQGYSSWKLDDLCTKYSNQYPDLIEIFSY